jgi:four helix bundle protein
MMHTDLQVYKESMQLVKDIYELTREFPKDEQWALTSQMKRSVISIPSNLAEGSGRRSSKELSHFLNISLGSLSELETQIEIAILLKFIVEPEVLEPLKARIQAIKRMLVALQKRVTAPSLSSK